MSSLVVGLDLAHTDERRADQDLQALGRTLPAGTVRSAATHWAREGDRPHVALSVELVELVGGRGVQLLVDRLAELAPRWSLAVGDEAHGEVSLQDAARRPGRDPWARAADLGRRRAGAPHPAGGRRDARALRVAHPVGLLRRPLS